MELNKKFVPKLAVRTTKGKELIIGEGSSKPTLLVFFTISCDSCQLAAPTISKAFAHLKPQLNLIGIGRDHKAQKLEEWAKKVGLEYDLIEDPQRTLFHKFAKIHVPRIYLIDTNGKVCYQDVNWHPFMLEDLEDNINKLLTNKK